MDEQYLFRLQHAADIGIAMIILLSFTFIPVGVLLYSVYEYNSKEKHMQFISGVTPFTYWIASLVWDMVRVIFIDSHMA